MAGSHVYTWQVARRFHRFIWTSAKSFQEEFFGSTKIIPFYAGAIRAIARRQHRI